jgi:Na+-translocating ferredoxin:NAD+ oxidoreductase RnfD subunit
MWLVSLCAALAIVQASVLSGSPAPLVMALCAAAAALSAEFAVNQLRQAGQTLKDGSALASALILVLLLPDHASPLSAAAGAVFAIVVVKHSFGGLGANWLNPALGGWLFMRVSWPGVFAAEGGQGISPAVLEQAGRAVRELLNRHFFLLFGAEIPADYPAWLLFSGPGIIAGRGVLALLLGSILISASQAGRVWIPALFLAVYGFLVRCAGGELPWTGDVLAALCSGATLVTAFFLLADPSSGAKSGAGAALNAAAAAVFAFVFRYWGGEALGAVFAAALVNALGPLVRAAESRLFYLGGSPGEIAAGKDGK